VTGGILSEWRGWLKFPHARVLSWDVFGRLNVCVGDEMMG